MTAGSVAAPNAGPRLLNPGGALCLFYDPPSAAKASVTAERLTTALGGSGFEASPTIETAGASYLVAVAARPR